MNINLNIPSNPAGIQARYEGAAVAGPQYAETSGPSGGIYEDGIDSPPLSPTDWPRAGADMIDSAPGGDLAADGGGISAAGGESPAVERSFLQRIAAMILGSAG